MSHWNRREILTGLACGAAALTTSSIPAQDAAPPPRVRFCLNTSTIRGQKLPIEQEVDLAASVGYDGIEPWINELETFESSGRPLSELRKRIDDAGLKVESAIGFAPWIVDDDEQRRLGLEHLKRDMDRVAQLGGTRIAAPPVGAHQADAPRIDLNAAAERYRAALQIGQELGVTPQLEVWGFSKNLSRLGETLYVASEAGHPQACLLLDVYHLRRGGSSFAGLPLIASSAMHCFHFNDYPEAPPAPELNDSDRVYPGDGAAPWDEILGALKGNGFAGVVSLELFNRDYWKQDPRQVAETGLKKMQALFA